MKTTLNFLKYFSLVTLFIFTSCVNDDTNVTPSNEKPILTATQTEFTVKRGETIGIPISISRPINNVIPVELLVTGGTARKGIDYVAGDGDISADFGNPDESFIADIPPTVETFEIPFTALEAPSDDTYNTVEIDLKAVGIRTALFEGNTQRITINIEPSDNFLSRVEWDAIYVDVDGNEHSFCDFDMDLELYNATTFQIVATSYSSCPEEILIAPGDLPDGDYFIVPSFWSQGGAATPADAENIPVTMTVSKPGVFTHTFDLTEVPAWSNFAFGAGEGNIDAYLFDVALLNIQGSTFTVTDPDTSEVIVQGRPQ
ncbi:hypothetical protein [Psychroflexus sp. MBR-150]|jgi:hypothetical protein